MDDSELQALGFVAVNLLGQTGIPMLDEYADKITPTLLSDYHRCVMEDLLDAIRKERQNG